VDALIEAGQEEEFCTKAIATLSSRLSSLARRRSQAMKPRPEIVASPPANG